MDTPACEEVNIDKQEQKHRDPASELIVSGRISKAVWFLAWPTIINTLFFTAYNLINRAFLGRIEDAAPALAAVGVGGVIMMTQQSVMFGVTAGTAALVSRFLGAEENNDADEATGQSLVLSVAAAILTAIPLILFTDTIVAFAGANKDVVPYAAIYLKVLAMFSPIMFLRMTIQTALRSAGDAKSPLYTGAVLVSVNILLDWLLIFGHDPVYVWGHQVMPRIPAIGILGAAIATGVSHLCAFLVILIFLKKSVLRNSIAHLKPHFGWFARIMNIGWPAVLQNLMWSTGFAAYIKVLSLLPNAADAQAALTVGIAIESTAFMPGTAYSIAAAPLVGQNLGAGKPKRAEHAAWMAMWQAVAIMSVVAIAFLVIPRQLAMMFSTNESVIGQIASYLRINGVFEPFLAVAMVLTGALQGAGDTRMPTVVEFLTSWVMRLPLAWFLAIHLAMGTTGAWIAMAFTTFLYGVLIAGWFKLGRWKNLQV